MFLPLTRIFFAVGVSGKAVRIFSRVVRIFPAPSLLRVPPSYGTFSLMIFQGNCSLGRTGHIITAVLPTNYRFFPDTVMQIRAIII